MKGVLFNVVEDAVVEMFDDEMWDGLLEEAGVDGAYTALGDYPHTDLVAIVNAAAARLDMDPGDVLRTVGARCFGHLLGRYPAFGDAAANARDFVVQVESFIHPEVLKLYPSATLPRFEFEHRDDGVLRMTYRSDRCLAPLAEGLVEGAAAHFGETIDITPVASAAGGATATVDLRFRSG